MSNVTLIRDGAPLLSDVPGMLRALANDIEAGTHGAVESAIVIVPVRDDYPHAFHFGEVNGGTNEAVLQLELAKLWLLNNLVVRT